MRSPPSRIWNDAAARIAGKESEIVLNDQQERVLDYLWNNFRGLYLGSPGQAHSKETILEISRDLSKNTSTANKRERFDFLARGFERGNLTLPGWDVPLGPVYIKVNREENYSRQDRFRPLGQAEKFIGAFCLSLESSEITDGKVLLGQLLVSAIIFAGLLDRKCLRPFHDCIQKGHYYQEGPVFWVEIAEFSSVGRAESYGNEATDQKLRRLIPDHLTRLLIYRYHRLREKAGLILPPCDPWDCISSFMKDTAFPKNVMPRSLNELYKWTFARSLTILPHSLVAYASGKLEAVSLPIAPWLRTISGMVIPVTKPALDSQLENIGTKPKIIANKRTKKSEQERLLSELLKSLRYNKKTTKSLRRKTQTSKNDKGKVTSQRARRIINAFILQNSSRMSTTLQLLLQWALRLLNEKVSYLERRKKRSIKPTSVDKYLSSIGYALLNVAGDLLLHDLEPQELETVYEQVSLRLSQDNFAMNRLRQFHGFMQVFYGGQAMEWGDMFGEDDKPRSSVSANIITSEIYHEVLRSLGWGQTEHTRWQKLHIISFILLYRCGLRPSELQALRLKDVQGVTEYEILIRNSRLNNIKTNSGIRRIPVSSMLLPNELQLFLGYYKMRLEEDRDFGGGLLLTHPVHFEGLLSDEELFEPIRGLLKAVAKDETLLLYHLRHSLMTWTDTILQLSEERYKTEFPDILPSSEEMALVSKLFEFLYGNESTGRKGLYLLAMIAGHASPETTSHHYCHLLDLVLGHQLNDPDNCIHINNSIVMSITGLRRSTVYELLNLPINIHPLHNVVANESVKYRDKLKHPLMRSALPVKGPTPSPKIMVLQSWEDAIASMPDKSVLTALLRSKAEWDFAAEIYEAVRGLDGRKIKTAQKVLTYFIENFSDRYGGVNIALDSKAILIKSFLTEKRMPKTHIVVVLHPAKRLSAIEIEGAKRHWADVLDIPLNMISVGEHVTAKLRVKVMVTVKFTIKQHSSKKIREHRMSSGFMLAIDLLHRQFIK